MIHFEIINFTGKDIANSCNEYFHKIENFKKCEDFNQLQLQRFYKIEDIIIKKRFKELLNKLETKTNILLFWHNDKEYRKVNYMWHYIELLSEVIDKSEHTLYLVKENNLSEENIDKYKHHITCRNFSIQYYSAKTFYLHLESIFYFNDYEEVKVSPDYFTNFRSFKLQSKMYASGLM